MVLLKIAVKDDKLIKVRDRLMIEDTINGIKCHFEFRSGWNNLKPTVAFARGHIYPATENPQTIPAFLDDNNECIVPPEIISERGEFSVGLIGENDDTRIVTHWLYYKTQLGCYDAITPPNPPTPSEYDKILGVLNNKSEINHTHDEYITDEEMNAALEDVKQHIDTNGSGAQYGIEYDPDTNKIKLTEDVSKKEIDVMDFINDNIDDISITHSWNGTVLTITSASGTSSADLKGKDGVDGKDGRTPVKGVDYFDGTNGENGYTPIKGIDYFDGIDGKDGYTPVKGVDYFDGKDGTDGKDGYTPVKGVDYFDGVNGEDGYTPVKGVDYRDGVDGVSPTVTVQEISGGYRVVITDKNGDKTFDIMNGKDGVGSSGGATAKIGEVTLLADAWVGEDNLYSQVVSIEGVTENSQVDLTPDVQQLAIFYNKDLAFVTENEGGIVTVYAIGQKPANDYTIQVTITEVDV